MKIDRNFVGNIVPPGESLPIVQAVIAIASARGMTTTAEGVETEGQREVLRAAGCTEMQGFLFSKPVPPKHLHTLFERETARGVPSAEAV